MHAGLRPAKKCFRGELFKVTVHDFRLEICIARLQEKEKMKSIVIVAMITEPQRSVFNVEGTDFFLDQFNHISVIVLQQCLCLQVQ